MQTFITRSALKSLQKLFLLLCLAGISYAGNAQQQKRETIDPRKDKITVEQYVVQVVPTIGGDYGFAIIEGKRIIFHQVQNIIPGKRLAKKSDVYTIAKWMIAEYHKTNQWPTAVSPAVVKQLKIAFTD